MPGSPIGLAKHAGLGILVDHTVALFGCHNFIDLHAEVIYAGEMLMAVILRNGVAQALLVIKTSLRVMSSEGNAMRAAPTGKLTREVFLKEPTGRSGIMDPDTFSILAILKKQMKMGLDVITMIPLEGVKDAGCVWQ